jgi:hypothetical protein
MPQASFCGNQKKLVVIERTIEFFRSPKVGELNVFGRHKLGDSRKFQSPQGMATKFFQLPQGLQRPKQV